MKNWKKHQALLCVLTLIAAMLSCAALLGFATYRKD